MTKLKFNPMFEQLQGAFGDIVFRQTPAGRIFISHKPDMSNVVWRPAQIANRALQGGHRLRPCRHARSARPCHL